MIFICITHKYIKMIDVEHMDGLKYLDTIPNNSIDLVLTDPPYIISKDTGMNKFFNKVNQGENVSKTVEEWEEYKLQTEDEFKKKKRCKGYTNTHKNNYLEYGTIYGKKYSVQTDYGDWDNNFTLDVLSKYIEQYYMKLRKGGTCIIFFDIWKLTTLKELMEQHGFKQLRFIEWVKTNPQPLNSNINYLTNCREIALLGVKVGKGTFNSKYDNGIYQYPLQGGKYRVHPTQKSLALFEDIVKKHSNEDDTILDTFLGSGTTAFACKNTNRNFKGCEISKKYYDCIQHQLNS